MVASAEVYHAYDLATKRDNRKWVLIIGALPMRLQNAHAAPAYLPVFTYARAVAIDVLENPSQQSSVSLPLVTVANPERKYPPQAPRQSCMAPVSPLVKRKFVMKQI